MKNSNKMLNETILSSIPMLLLVPLVEVKAKICFPISGRRVLFKYCK
jgi:hypothetical protein